MIITDTTDLTSYSSGLVFAIEQRVAIVGSLAAWVAGSEGQSGLTTYEERVEYLLCALYYHAKLNLGSQIMRIKNEKRTKLYDDMESTFLDFGSSLLGEDILERTEVAAQEMRQQKDSKPNDFLEILARSICDGALGRGELKILGLTSCGSFDASVAMISKYTREPGGIVSQASGVLLASHAAKSYGVLTESMLPPSIEDIEGGWANWFAVIFYAWAMYAAGIQSNGTVISTVREVSRSWMAPKVVDEALESLLFLVSIDASETDLLQVFFEEVPIALKAEQSTEFILVLKQGMRLYAAYLKRLHTYGSR